MKKVILLRHAKSSWVDPSLDDADRPLNPRGIGAAPVIGRWLEAKGHVPDTVLCSPALRARETVRLIAPEMPGMPEPVLEPDIYMASPAELMACLRRLPETSASVMLVGHQPGLSALARKLSDGRARPRCSRAFEHFPTAAAAVLLYEGDAWADIAAGAARFVDFAKPRELIAA